MQVPCIATQQGTYGEYFAENVLFLYMPAVVDSNSNIFLPTIKRHELWRMQYRQRRYLQRANMQEIQARSEDLLNNLGDFDAQGRFSFKDPRIEEQWIVLFTHVLEELSLRGQGHQAMLRRGGSFDPKRSVNCKRAAELWTGRDLQRGTYLLKFGKLEHLRLALDVGTFRIASANYYRDPSLNFAIQDSELEFTEELYGAKVHYPPNRDYSIPENQWKEMPIIGNVKSTRRLPGDYYVACFAQSYEYRLFDDFGYEACLVIKDIRRFIDAVGWCVHEQLPGWKFLLGPVEYRDPYHPAENIDLFFCKHFRYAYQREFRFVWQSPKPIEELKPIYLELGPLNDYCELLGL